MSLQSFNCPNCNAPLQHDDHGSPTVICTYCNSTVIVPEALRYHAKTHAPGRGGSNVNIQGLDALTQVGILMAQGKKIEAIKVYRQAFGVGLQEAKDAVEALERGEAVEVMHMPGASISTSQYDYSASAGGGSRLGCWLFVIIMAVIIGVVVVLVPLGIIAPLSAIIPDLSGIPGVSNIPGVSGFLDAELTIGGEEGTGPGFFNDTRWVGVDEAGNIYTADFDGGRVQVFDVAGNFITQWFTENQQVITDMTVDRPGTVYLLETGHILRYEGLTGTPLGRVGRDEDRFDAITISAEGDLVAVSREMMMRFNPQGGIKQEVTGLFDNLPGVRGIINIRDIAVDGVNNLYVLPVFDATIFKFNSQGVYQDRIGQEGDTDEDFTSPNALAIDGQGRFFVDDFHGLLVFDSSGRHIETIQVGGVAFSLVFDLNQNLFRMDRNGNQVVKYAVLK